jgi:hypothetical protein
MKGNAPANWKGYLGQGSIWASPPRPASRKCSPLFALFTTCAAKIGNNVNTDSSRIF